MSVKLIAMGNVLMKDDAIGIEVAKKLEERLIEKNIEVIYGETDFQYCLANVKETDFIFILDAVFSGKKPGEVTVITLDNFNYTKKGYTQHTYSFLDLLKLYFINMEGVIFAIEVKEIEFSLGLSSVLQEKLKDIANFILNEIEVILMEKVVK